MNMGYQGSPLSSCTGFLASKVLCQQAFFQEIPGSKACTSACSRLHLFKAFSLLQEDQAFSDVTYGSLPCLLRHRWTRFNAVGRPEDL